MSEDEDESQKKIGGGGRVSETPLSRAFLPDVWKDDARMNALFTEFRSRDLNPAAYDGKMKFWTENIEKCILDQDLVVFSPVELREKFERKGRMPQVSTISAALQELKRQNTFHNNPFLLTFICAFSEVKSS